jgi:nucleoside-diphosphate-sugar epimerase
VNEVLSVEGDSWRGKRVLVTGSDGFMGSHLVERLVHLGATVTAFTRGTSTHGTSQLSLKNLPAATGVERVIAGNVANPETTRIIEDAEPDIILHLAAEAYVQRSFDHPAEVFAVNAVGTLHVLEAARRLPKLERVVITSSSEVYGSMVRNDAINEDHPLNPTSPYAASKVAADRLGYSYITTYGIPISIIRPFNFYGPRHTYDVIPKFIRLALRGEDLTVYGTGLQRRDFTYVDDMARAFLLMASHPAAVGQVVNFGSGRSHAIGEIAERIVSLTGAGSRIVHDHARLAEVDHLICDARKAFDLFEWRAMTSIEDGLRQNIEWERRRLEIIGS